MMPNTLHQVWFGVSYRVVELIIDEKQYQKPKIILLPERFFVHFLVDKALKHRRLFLSSLSILRIFDDK